MVSFMGSFQDAQLNFTNIIKDNNCYVLFDYVYETYLTTVPKVFVWLFNKIGSWKTFLLLWKVVT